MGNPQHLECLLEGVAAWNARREQQDFRPDFHKVDVRQAFVEDAVIGAHQRLPLENVILREADLREAILWGANLVGANLGAANLGGANLVGADLVEANLRGADLWGANLEGANLGGANLGGTNLVEANLREAKLREADLVEADLREANLREADLSEARVATRVYSAAGINNESAAEYTNLSIALNLTQAQLDSMFGDSGTIIPGHLERPAHWPEVELVDLAQSPNPKRGQNRFAFLSYAAENRAIVGTIQKTLSAVNLATWWDQQIEGGAAWRDRLSEKLEDASAVVTFWTAESVVSKPVREEASRAQSAGKLIPVRLDGAPLPFGFEETQWIDLRQWDGTDSDPNFRKLLQTIRDKLNPPGMEELADRQRATSPVDAKNNAGRIGLYDTPVNTAARVQNKEDLAARLAGLWSSINRVTREVSDPTAYQLPDEARRRLAALAGCGATIR